MFRSSIPCFFPKQRTQRRLPQRFCLSLVTPWLFCLGGIHGSHAQEVGKSDHIKAAYLFNLLKFTTWPESEAHTSLNLCLLGEKTGGMEVAQQELHKRSTQSRTLNVTHILAPSLQNAPTELADCQLLYLNLPQTKMQELLQFASAHHMLTLSELTHSAQRGAMVEFAVDERKNRVVIIINERSAKTAGIFFSAKLLQLADVIRE